MRCILPWVAWLLLACLTATAWAGEIADLHAERAAPMTEEGPAVDGDGAIGVAQRGPPVPGIVRIGLERVPGFTGGPGYWVLIDADGSFRYVGQANVARMGELTGTVPPGPLRLLLAYVADIGIRELEDTYASRFLDQPSTYLLAEWPGETKVILNYGYSGPMTLWAMGRLIDALLDEAEWDAP